MHHIKILSITYLLTCSTTNHCNKMGKATAKGAPKTPEKTSTSLGVPVRSAKMRIDFSPSKGKARNANQIDVYPTLVEPIVISVACRHDKENEAAYIFPMKKTFTENEGHDLHCNDWKINGFFERRATGSRQSNNTPLKVESGSNYIWECMVTLINKEEDSDTPASVGRNIARSFTLFEKDKNKSHMEHPEIFVFRQAIHDKMALNEYLLDKDCLYFLKKCFQDNTMEELTGDKEVMSAFFGTAARGWAVMEHITAEDWEDIFI